MPSVNPVSAHVNVDALVVQPVVAGLVVTWYPVVSDPLALGNSDHAMVLRPDSCVFVMPVGAHGTAGALPAFTNLFGDCGLRELFAYVTIPHVDCCFSQFHT